MTSDRLAGYSRLMATLTLLLIAGMLLLNAACWIFPDLASEHGLGFALTATKTGLAALKARISSR
ncbi:hypothetical protein ACLBWI_36555, partial [Pseudomonas aeruginosa]